MPAKSSQLQIRVTPAQKAHLRKLAARAGLDVSAYVLERALPPARDRLDRAIRALLATDGGDRQTHAFAEFGDALTGLGTAEFADAVATIHAGALAPFARNYVAATVEYLCAKRGIEPPAWARDVEPLDAPWFAAPLDSLRLHLLYASPVPFRRRNLFVDSTADNRV